MSEHDDWNPEDGPPPTEEERAEARAAADRLASPSAKSKGRDADIDAIVEVALRVKATAHPDNERSKQVSAAAVNEALQRADARWYRSRWRWVALVAAAVVGIGGIQLAQFRPHVTEDVPLISHPAGDEFRTELPHDARSMPIGRITDSRMRAYRNVLLHGGR